MYNKYKKIILLLYMGEIKSVGCEKDVVNAISRQIPSFEKYIKQTTAIRLNLKRLQYKCIADKEEKDKEIINRGTLGSCGVDNKKVSIYEDRFKKKKGSKFMSPKALNSMVGVLKHELLHCAMPGQEDYPEITKSGLENADFTSMAESFATYFADFIPGIGSQPDPSSGYNRGRALLHKLIKNPAMRNKVLKFYLKGEMIQLAKILKYKNPTVMLNSFDKVFYNK